jgi:hypothetical protein
VAFDGTLVALITTGTGVVELIVVSGKLNGFALIGIPLMLVTVIAGGGTVGRFNEKGRDVTTGPLPLLPIPEKVESFASSRANPGCGAVLQSAPPLAWCQRRLKIPHFAG